MRMILAIFILSFNALASDFSFIPQQNEEQKNFVKALADGQWEDALTSWPKAFPGTGFANSDDGRALRLFIYASSGLPALSTKMLVRETDYAKLSPAVKALWQPFLQTYVFELPHGLMTASWTKQFFLAPMKVSSAKEISKILTRLKSADVDDGAKASQYLSLVSRAAQWNDLASALKALDALRSLKQAKIGVDQIDLATARVYYQKKNLDEALKYYNKIPKESDFWLEAVEEKAWTYLRKKDHDNAVGQITTAMAPIFSSLTGPETYFLSELTSLQVCDYPKILKTSQLFKARHKERLNQIKLLAETGSNKIVPQAFDEIVKKGLTTTAVGSQIKFLPRNFLRDDEFIRNAKYFRDLTSETPRAHEISMRVGGDPELEKAVGESAADINQAKTAAMNRLKKLAQDDVAEYRVIINKLHIVEAQVIERLYVDESLRGKRPDLAKNQDPKNTLSFPYTDEVWIDEIDHYKANVKDCPALPHTKEAAL